MIMMNKIQIKELQEKIHDKALIMYQLIKFLKIDESQKKGVISFANRLHLRN